MSEDPIGFSSGQINHYVYVGNNPLNFSDPSGNCPHCLFGAGVGGVVGLAGQGITDLINGELSSFSDYAGSLVSGAVTGGTIALTGGTSLLATDGIAAFGGATGNLTTQGIDNITGAQQGINLLEVAGSGAISGLSGGLGSRIPIKLPGITSGRNSFSAIGASTTTKLRNDTIQNVSFQTFGKTATSELISGLPSDALGIGIDSAVDFFSTNFGSGAANGGFVLYPNKINNNITQSVYSK